MALYNKDLALNAGAQRPPLASQEQPMEQPMEVDMAGSSQRMEEDLAKFVDKGTILIHSPETRDQILVILKHGNSIEDIAEALVFTVQRLDAISRKAGIEINDQVKLKGAEDLINQIIEVGETANLFKITDEQRTLAYSLGLQNYLNEEISTGRIDKQKLSQEILQAVEQLPEDKRQDLDSQLKGINQTAEAYKRQQPQAQSNTNV